MHDHCKPATHCCKQIFVVVHGQRNPYSLISSRSENIVQRLQPLVSAVVNNANTGVIAKSHYDVSREASFHVMMTTPSSAYTDYAITGSSCRSFNL